MGINSPDAVIFDWDNTLVDTWPTIHEALNHTFTRMGHEPWDINMVKQRVARSMRDSFPDIFGSNWQEAATIYQSSFRSIHLDKLKALPGAESMLEWLSKQAVYMAVASNKKGPNLRKEAEYIGWNKYFSKLIGADDTPKDKPAPEPVHAALDGSNIRAGKKVWFIGDSEIDMECAIVTGCIPVFYGELPPRPLNHQYQIHVKNHEELTNLFKDIFK